MKSLYLVNVPHNSKGYFKGSWLIVKGGRENKDLRAENRFLEIYNKISRLRV